MAFRLVLLRHAVPDAQFHDVIVYALKLVNNDHAPLLFILTIPLGTDGTPCEQPAPASNAYKSLPINSTSATPEINPLLPR